MVIRSTHPQQERPARSSNLVYGASGRQHNAQRVSNGSQASIDVRDVRLVRRADAKRGDAPSRNRIQPVGSRAKRCRTVLQARDVQLALHTCDVCRGHGRLFCAFYLLPRPTFSFASRSPVSLRVFLTRQSSAPRRSTGRAEASEQRVNHECRADVLPCAIQVHVVGERLV